MQCTASTFSVLHCKALHCIVLHCTALNCTAFHCTAMHYVFRSIVALHSFRLKLCSVKYIVQCTAHNWALQQLNALLAPLLSSTMHFSTMNCTLQQCTDHHSTMQLHSPAIHFALCILPPCTTNQCTLQNFTPQNQIKSRRDIAVINLLL